MKSLILAILFFGIVIYGCYDVKPFKAVRKLVRKPGKASQQTGPLQPEVEEQAYYEPPMRRYR